MPLRRPPVLPQLDDVIELLRGIASMLMQVDAKLERVLSILEEEE